MDEGEHGGCALVAHMSVQIIKNIAAAIPGCIAAEGPKGAISKGNHISARGQSRSPRRGLPELTSSDVRSKTVLADGARAGLCAAHRGPGLLFLLWLDRAAARFGPVDPRAYRTLAAGGTCHGQQGMEASSVEDDFGWVVEPWVRFMRLGPQRVSFEQFCADCVELALRGEVHRGKPK